MFGCSQVIAVGNYCVQIGVAKHGQQVVKKSSE